MHKSEHLFYLIKSLDKSEKRYFKHFCFNQNTPTHFLKVFDAMDRQKEPDDKQLKWKFRNEKFVQQFHVIKNYIYHAILRALRNFYAEQSKYAQALDGIRNVEILFQKELFEICMQEIQRLHKSCMQYEFYALLLELLNWKRRILLMQNGRLTPNIQAVMDEEEQALECLRRSHDYWNITFHVFEYRGPGQEKLWEQYAMSYQEKEGLRNQTQRAHILYTYYTINSAPEKGKAALDELIQEMENYPERIKENPSTYANALNNSIGALLFEQRNEEVWPLLEKVRSIPKQYKLKQKSPFSIRLKLRTYNIELELLRDAKNWQKGMELSGVVAKFLEKNEKRIPTSYQIMLAYQFAYIHFHAGELGVALKWCNELLNRPFTNDRIDIQVYSRFLNLMIHFEMDNTFVLKYAVESSRRFFRKEAVKAIIPAFASVFLRFFSKISNTPKREFPEKLAQLHQELFEGEALITDRQLDYLDIKTWIANKTSLNSLNSEQV